jgi:nickel/cobalt exporter
MLKVIIFGTFMISILHAIIPSHWLPILSISKSRKWTKRETLRVTFLAGLAHVCSTIVLGLFISYFGAQLKLFLEDFLKIVLTSITYTFWSLFSLSTSYSPPFSH